MSTGPEPASPRISDRHITTLAILKVSSDDAHGFLGNYLPFLYHCLAESEPDAVSTPELQQMLEDTFGIELPLAILKRLLTNAMEQGKVHVANGVYLVNRDTLQGCSLSQARKEAVRGYHQLLNGLIDFTKNNNLGPTWTYEKAEDRVSVYVDQFSSGVLASALKGHPPPKAPQGDIGDDYVVHRFVAHINEHDQTLFAFLEAAVKGRMLADALYFDGDSAPQDIGLDGVEVYFDGPLLLHILGYGGPQFQAPYTELLRMLKRQGATLRCFTHSVTEAQSILDVAADLSKRSDRRRSYPGDVISYLLRLEHTSADIYLMSNRLSKALLHAGIQTVGPPEPNAALRSDEERLEKMLQKVSYRNPHARIRDLDSLVGIHRLRGGRTFRDLSKCLAIFVTHNYHLFSVSTRFSGNRVPGRTVPHCVLHPAFTALVWLREPTSTPQLPHDRIVADAYAALKPSDKLWREYNSEIDKMLSSGSLDEDDIKFLRVADEARISLMDVTRGDADVFTEGTIREVLDRARQIAHDELHQELEVERRAKELAKAETALERERIERRAARAAKIVSTAVTVLLTLALVFGVVFGPYGPVHHRLIPSAIQLTCTAFAIGLVILSAVDLGSLRAAQRGLYGLLRDTFTSVTLRLRGVPMREARQLEDRESS